MLLQLAQMVMKGLVTRLANRLDCPTAFVSHDE
jgi:hypothetical protein